MFYTKFGVKCGVSKLTRVNSVKLTVFANAILISFIYVDNGRRPWITNDECYDENTKRTKNATNERITDGRIHVQPGYCKAR